MAAVNLDRLVEAHQAIKDARTAKRHAWEAEDALLEADQQKIKAVLLHMLNESGAKSFATDRGTVYRREVMKPSAADWGAIWTWMKEHDAPDLVERRLKVGFIQEYMEEHAGAIPPGINVHRVFEVSVRRPNNAPAPSSGASDDQAE